MRYIVFMAILLTSVVLQAQKSEINFGEVNKDDLKLMQCPFYSDADAMVLGKKGQLLFLLEDYKGWQYELEVTVRKKIFNLADQKYGNVKIPIYSPVGKEFNQAVTSLKGFTYNLVGDKIEKTKLKADDRFKNRINAYWEEVSFVMPNVKNGSVIEYKYIIKSDLTIELPTWYFQENIPVAHSEYQFTIPEYFRYQYDISGMVLPIEKKEDTKYETFTYAWKSLPDRGGIIHEGRDELNSSSTYNVMIAKRIPPAFQEPYRNNDEEIYSKAELQIVAIQMPEKPVEVIAGDFTSFNDQLLNSSAFGGRLGKGSFAKTKANELSSKDDAAKAEGIYNWIQNKMSWNEYTGIYSNKAGKAALQSGGGNCADINLSLVAAFREAGLNAYPVILSTRGNGVVNKSTPIFADYNYVIAAVIVGEDLYYADAANNLPFGMLPLHCMNGLGFIVSENGGQFADLKKGNHFVEKMGIKMNIQGDKIQSTIDFKDEKYAALRTLESHQSLGEKEFKTDLASDFDDWEVENIDIKSMSLEDGVSYTINMNQSLEDADILYIQPFPASMINEQPFKREERHTAIDFPLGVMQTKVSQITVPENYTIELPEDATFSMPDKAGLFSYSAKQTGNNVTIVCNYKISQTEYSPKDYQQIKNFIQMQYDKLNEPLILKR